MVLEGEPIIQKNGKKAKNRYEIIDLESKKKMEKNLKKAGSNLNNRT